MGTRRKNAKPARKKAAPAKAKATVQPFDATGDLTQLQEKVRLLLEENRRLAEELEALRQQSGALERVAAESTGQRTKLESELGTVKTRFEEQAEKLSEASGQVRTLSAQVKRLSLQARNTAISALTPEEASDLIERTIGSFKSPTLEVRDIDLTLKVATAKIGTEAVLVLPEPGKTDINTIHEIRLKLRNPALSGEVLKPR